MDQTSRLDIGQAVEPVEKALNGLTSRTGEGRKCAAGNQGIAFVLLSIATFKKIGSGKRQRTNAGSPEEKHKQEPHELR